MFKNIVNPETFDKTRSTLQVFKWTFFPSVSLFFCPKSSIENQSDGRNGVGPTFTKYWMYDTDHGDRSYVGSAPTIEDSRIQGKEQLIVFTRFVFAV